MTKPSAKTVPGVPPNLVAVYDKAGQTCGAVSGALLAAQGHQESWSFNPKVIDGEIKSPKGAVGIAQFLPDTFPHWGTGDPRNPLDAIPAQARYDCALAKDYGSLAKGNVVTAKKPEGVISNVAYVTTTSDPTAVMLAAYNAGEKPLKHYGGVPPYFETVSYINRIKGLMK